MCASSLAHAGMHLCSIDFPASPPYPPSHQVTEPYLAPFLSSTVLSSPSLEHLFATLLSDKLAVSWMLSTVKLAGLLEVSKRGGRRRRRCEVHGHWALCYPVPLI